jgi:hypothetical protein
VFKKARSGRVHDRIGLAAVNASRQLELLTRAEELGALHLGVTLRVPETRRFVRNIRHRPLPYGFNSYETSSMSRTPGPRGKLDRRSVRAFTIRPSWGAYHVAGPRYLWKAPSTLWRSSWARQAASSSEHTMMTLWETESPNRVAHVPGLLC